MDEKTVTIKVFLETRKLLRLICAMTGEKIVAVVHRLALQEWDRVK